MNNLIHRHQDEINRVCQEAGIRYLALFGSHAREEAKEKSDVDLLVEFKNTPGLIEFIQTKHQFEKVLKRKVDLVTKKGLSKYIASYITRDLQKIYG
ncbi:hypothetical protein A3D77_00965 [Candidatus Gottesmanbacteria bacterium RIFCSPHIGHO2_02_FULL_39_11]|uniref:Polymerase nucleotidyl transferase domain-containing protein n=1 Tax=Candidatus Gottesmanbacteria bacterium RIFCSPHIGHO2_02_FULL_39_11 TaxID=1798382 RepID=A0A1F5ZNV9_9BACT|nr:MAG: hypothetical protein A3D77_00965 [Candidatus Gottesmanbacteria bacterium RIFCSPHIGHO2_02_FULL_39_11]